MTCMVIHWNDDYRSSNMPVRIPYPVTTACYEMADGLTVESVMQGRFLRPFYVCICGGVVWSSFFSFRPGYDLIFIYDENISFFSFFLSVGTLTASR